ncbi:MAG: pirin-like C-terminal cupin domain-containing protein [Bradyrhizobium sp.]
MDRGMPDLPGAGRIKGRRLRGLRGVLDGALVGPDQSSLGKGTLAPLTAGSSVALTAATDRGPAIVAIIGGKPAEQPILFSGPFVMDSAEHLTRAKRDYSSGKMGRLDGVPF